MKYLRLLYSTLIFSAIFAGSPMISSSCWAKKSPSPVSKTTKEVKKEKEQSNQSETPPRELTAQEKKLAKLPPILAAALKIDTNAEQAIIVDYHTGQVLFE